MFVHWMNILTLNGTGVDLREIISSAIVETPIVSDVCNFACLNQLINSMNTNGGLHLILRSEKIAGFNIHFSQSFVQGRTGRHSTIIWVKSGFQLHCVHTSIWLRYSVNDLFRHLQGNHSLSFFLSDDEVVAQVKPLPSELFKRNRR